jgi:hypothetical protein
MLLALRLDPLGFYHIPYTLNLKPLIFLLPEDYQPAIRRRGLE